MRTVAILLTALVAACDAPFVRIEPAPSDSAVVYVYRPGMTGYLWDAGISVDGGQKRDLEAYGFLRLEVSPGGHTLVASGGNPFQDDVKLALNLKPGQLAFVRYVLDRGPTSVVFVVPEEIATKELQGLRESD